MTTMSPSDALPRRMRIGYGLGSVATGSFGTVPGLLLLPYLTDRLGVPAVAAGLIVLVPKAWDVILNPIAGRISDSSSSPQGRRRPFLLRAGVTLAVLFMLLFAGPASPAALGAAWVALAFLACASAYAFFQVPYVAMPAEMTLDYDERTRLMTWRVAILALAILVSGGLSPAIRDAVGHQHGYRAVGVFVALLILLGTYGAWRGTAGAPAYEAEAPNAGLRDQLRLVAQARDFRVLLVTFVLQALACGAMLAGVDYVARWVLGRPGASSILFVCFVAPALLVMPLWQAVGARWGKQRGYLAASLLFLLGALFAYAVRTTSLGLLAAAVALIGVAYAGVQLFPMAMLPDTAAADAARTGENRVGVFTGVWTGAETLGLALGPGVYALVLALGGYASSTSADATQSPQAVSAIAIGFALVPAVLVAVSLVPLARYRLDEAVGRRGGRS